MKPRSKRVRKRVLEAACQLFAERGFHGTHIRDVCKSAGVNIASVCYYFRGKEGLFDAVTSEACQTLARTLKRDATVQKMNPDERLQAEIKSLFERLSGNSEWIARLAARELFDRIEGNHGSVGAGLGDDIAIVEGAIRDLLGPKANRDTIRMHALSVLGQCVFWCLVREKAPKILSKFCEGLPNQRALAEHAVRFSLDAVTRGSKSHLFTSPSAVGGKSNPTLKPSPRQFRKTIYPGIDLQIPARKEGVP
jgi:AcrR family transcriptional regulator